MAKAKTVYGCEACGAQAPKWQGQCPDCGAWNTLVEQAAVVGPSGGQAIAILSQGIQRLGEAAASDEMRASTGIGELDRVLGGGLVPGSVTLLGGDPGIGKSTLLLQASAAMNSTFDVLYVTGEESLRQVGMRASRLGLEADNLSLLPETCVERLVAMAGKAKPGAVIVDSIQTIYSEALQSAPGSVAQLRETAAQLVRFAKSTGCAVILVGHVTKEGVIAGPRVLEHMVDTVLYFESDAGSRYRVIRAVKNRFGAANELGVFAMTEGGLKEVRNPSAIFLSRHERPVAGSIVMVTREGSRPLLVEVQALVDDSLGQAPRRVTVGLEQNRLALLLAVLHRHGGVSLAGQDVFVNVVGGIRVAETAADLPAMIAAVSSFRDQVLNPKLVMFGEVGLAGEIRPVPFGEERLAQAAKHGFKRAVVPTANVPRKPLDGLKVTGVARVEDALEAVAEN
ncbi:MAG: DNA repair protein RadA [Gammaproteobacteria bacterium]|nr:DNA repair protein RadA [Gammaproteobacteria bacterium]